ncbi:hypothetical protein FHL15_000978 [Xylaria flabelliformis]|uniref:Methyltransferase domain-containing protein n=1 Tax=Xylaria flabelliformis TaxID=2512241 RepID=A0A553IDS1_9PEZI|nr:hypothetical protein FHL15_000978 [Xylaria flabelliformis]
MVRGEQEIGSDFKPHPGGSQAEIIKVWLADTVELSDEVQETFYLHNRLFQRYAIDNNTYFVPVDEVCHTLPIDEREQKTNEANKRRVQDETLRLRLQHSVLTMMFDNRFIFPPIDTPRRVLDCGFGTGEWALQVAWEHPRCEVRGIDITPHHHNPEEGLENLYLDIDDLNMPLVAGGINTERWTGYIRDIFRSLRPGGWVQMAEIDFNAQSDNGALADNSALRQWSQTYLFAMEQCKNPRAPRRLGGWLRNAGFTDVDERMIPLPMCAWSDNQRDYDIGAANQENVRMLLSSVALYPFTHYLRYAPQDTLSKFKGNVDDHSSMSITEFHVLVAKARTEAANSALKKTPSIAILDSGIWGTGSSQMDICVLLLVSRPNWEFISRPPTPKKRTDGLVSMAVKPSGFSSELDDNSKDLVAHLRRWVRGPNDVAVVYCGLLGHWSGAGALTGLGCSLTTTPRDQSGSGQKD